MTAREQLRWLMERNRSIVFLCLFGAILLALFEKDGWGWLLFVAVLLA